MSSVEERLRALELEVLDLRRALARMEAESERAREAFAAQLRGVVGGGVDEAEVVVANAAQLFSLLARHWKSARTRVVSIVAGPGGGAGALGAVPAPLFVTALEIALGLGAGAGTLGIGKALDPVLAGLAQLVGAGEVEDAKVNAWVELHAKRPSAAAGAGFAYLVGGAEADVQRLGTPGKPALRSAQRTVDPAAYFVECAVRLMALAEGWSEGPFDDEPLRPGERPAMFAPASACTAAREAVSALASGSAWAQVRAHYFWKLLFVRPDPDGYDESWAILELLVEQAMTRLAWTLYCRSKWTSRTTDYTVMLRDDFLLDESKAWAEKNPRDWPRAAWTTAGFHWPPHFLQHIVPDFAGWESDPESPLQGPDPAERALAEYRHAHETHFSRAVYHCCQVRPGKAMKGSAPIDLFIEGAEDFVKGFASTGKRTGQKKFAAARGDLHLAEVRVGAPGQSPDAPARLVALAPNVFEGATKVTSDRALTVTVRVHAAERTIPRAHVYLFGPVEFPLTAEEGFEFPEDPVPEAFAYASVALEGGKGEFTLPGLEPEVPGVYALLLGPAPEPGDTTAYATDVFYFDFDWP